MQGFLGGQATELQAHQSGTLATLPDLPTSIDAASTAAYIRAVLDGKTVQSWANPWIDLSGTPNLELGIQLILNGLSVKVKA